MKNTKKKNGAAKGKGRAALSAQQTIPYLSMHPDGVCKLPGGLYTKTVEYEDINYSVASTEGMEGRLQHGLPIPGSSTGFRS